MSVTLRFENRRFMQVCVELATRAPEIGLQTLSRPVFVIGVPRSGTSLLTKMLLTHPQIGGFPQEGNELWHPRLYPWRAREAAAQIAPYEISPKVFTCASLSKWQPADSLRLKATFGIAQYLCGTPVFVNKSSMLCFMLPHLLELFPEAKFIYVVRDGRAAVYSRALKEGKKMEDHAAIYRTRGFFLTCSELLEYVARAWVDSLKEIAQRDEDFGLTACGVLTEVRYEDLCAQPVQTMKRLAEFIGVAPDGVHLDRIHTESQNNKYRTDLDAQTMMQLTRLTEVGLRMKGYL